MMKVRKKSPRSKKENHKFAEVLLVDVSTVARLFLSGEWTHLVSYATTMSY